LCKRKKTKKNVYNRSSTIEDLPLLLMTDEPSSKRQRLERIVLAKAPPTGQQKTATAPKVFDLRQNCKSV
jgi:hypothetical protein